MGSATGPAIPLFTSLPPSMARRDRDGAEIGAAYAGACIASWAACGFRPVSVNSRHEPPPSFEPAARVARHGLERDARATYGKPLPYLCDMLAAMRADGAPVVALTNADILLQIPPVERERLAALAPGECVVLKRTDVTDVTGPAGAGGAEYAHGYDFFALHRDDIPRLASLTLVFGKPWWDHFLPLALLLAGVRAVTLHEARALHLLHDERWDWEDHARIGRRFTALLQDRVPKDAARLNGRAGTGHEFLTEARRLSGPRGRRDIPRYYARQLTEPGRRKTMKAYLHRLSDFNIRKIDAWRTG